MAVITMAVNILPQPAYSADASLLALAYPRLSLHSSADIHVLFNFMRTTKGVWILLNSDCFCRTIYSFSFFSRIRGT